MPALRRVVGLKAVLAAIVVIAVVAAIAWKWNRRTYTAQRAASAEFIGAAKCAACHPAEAKAWKGSHHDLAMQEARPGSVLGDFKDARFTYGNAISTFFRRGDAFFVRTDGADGTLQDFEIKYTFGVEPLQQYLIELAGGRLQPLSIAWDSRTAGEGGQRWFHLYPGQSIGHTDELHWTSRQQNWNFMCAGCHSTNVRKGYDAETDSFKTTWSEINVGCEACHGPGSRHVQWADTPGWVRSLLWNDSGLTAPLTGRPTGQPGAEVETCAQCHSRRAQIAEGYVAGASLLDYYIPSLIEPGLYYPDGQQRDEVYVYGSFLQSRMYSKGVTCSDCHDPHTQKLRVYGNGLCTQCHAPDKFDTSSHHFHEPGTNGAACVSCHMPETTYMVVDARRDHSFSIPRPDRTVTLGVPNACNRCHTDRGAPWAADAVRKWYGRDATGFQRFAEAFAADEGDAQSADLVSIAGDATQPKIVRASALQRLARQARQTRQTTAASLEAATAALRHADPTVRRAGLLDFEALPPPERINAASAYLVDPSRAVRLQAAWLLAPVRRSLSGDTRTQLDRVADEFIASHRYNADRAESRATLGSFLARLERVTEATAEYRDALKLSPKHTTAYVNLADLYRTQGNEAEAERTLRDGLSASPDDASLHYALGLSLARSNRNSAAMVELQRAAALAPDSEAFAYGYALALQSSGKAREAIRILEQALAKHPRSRDLLFALSTFHRDAANTAEALRYARRLAEASPGDAEALALLQSLQRVPGIR